MSEQHDGGEKVQLYVYDLSNGLARAMSRALIGKQIDAIWHTAIVVGGAEYFYGGGIQKSVPGRTPFGQPVEIVDLGMTQIPAEVREDYLHELSRVFTPEAYHLFHNNCNTFSNEFSTFLTGNGIPAHITSLPQEVLATPFGQMLAPMMAPLESQLGRMGVASAYHPTTADPPPATPAAPEAATSTPAAPRAPAPRVAPATGAPARPVSSATPPPQPSFDTPAPAAAASSSAGPGARAAAAAEIRLAAAALAETSGKAKEIQQATDQVAKMSLGVSSEKAAFEAAIRLEFAKIMAAGGAVTPNEAAALAVKRVAAARA